MPAGHRCCRVTNLSPRAKVSRAMVSEIRRRSIEPTAFDPRLRRQRSAQAAVLVPFGCEWHWCARLGLRTRSHHRTKTNRRQLRQPTRGAQSRARRTIRLGSHHFSNSQSGIEPLKRQPRVRGETWVGPTVALPVRERQRPAMAWRSRRGGVLAG